jgi:FHA domain-containing protein
VITLTVIAHNDSPADGTLQAHFDELGGSIGRADSNQLVLPDPERLVSRIAAQVIYRNGAFAIVNRGSNPIRLNGREITSQEAPLAAGDRVRISAYELSVKMGGATASAPSDPFAGLLGPAAITPVPGGPLLDPLMQRSGQPTAPAALQSKPTGPQAAPAAGGIPVDWDPFGSHGKPPSPNSAAAADRHDALGLQLGAAAPQALIPDLATPSAAASSLDQLFGLSSSGGGDPLANSALDAPMAQPNMAADADPMRSLKSAPKASAASQADQMSDLQRPFIPPTVIKPATAVRALPTRPTAEPLVARAEPARTPAPAPAPVPAPAPALVPAPAPAPAVSPSHAAAPAPTAAPAAAARVPAAPGSDDATNLLEAFRRGLNAPTVQLPALTPAVMELVGQLLHEAVRGTLAQLSARASAKHELRATATVIVTKQNNPLKFSPDTEVALQHLLAPPMRGFMSGVPALRDACEDLRAHQSGFVAGMEAVLQAALDRFDPHVFEGQLSDRSRLQSLLPARRHARLWQLFTEHHAQIRSEASKDFHSLFDSAFLKAYDAHINQLQDQRDVDGKES